MNERMSRPRAGVMSRGLILATVLTVMATATTVGSAPAAGASPLPIVCTQTFGYTGTVQEFAVPLGVSSVSVDAYGAEGGDTYAVTGNPGLGGFVQSTVPVTPMEILSVVVGQQGTQTGTGGGSATFGGGGGTLGATAGQGGGASDVRQGGSALGDRIVVAGGGGGSGHGEIGSHGGHGGHPAGGKGTNSPDGTGDESGYGGTQASGGAPGTLGTSYVGASATGGSLGQGGYGGSGVGGSHEFYGGGGGGGGYYGGGGGKGGSGQLSPSSYADGAGGGGGSSFGPPGSFFVTGARAGHGLVRITLDLPYCESTEYPSDQCDAGDNLASGYVGDVYAKARILSEGSTTSLCVAVDDGTEHVGGKLSLRTSPTGDPLGVDQGGAAFNECRAAIPVGTALSGTVAGEPYYVAAASPPPGSPDSLWVCVRLTAAVSLRLRVRADVVDLPVVRLDVPTPHPPYPEAAWPVSGQPSALCQGQAGATRVANMEVGQTPVAVYTWQESASRMHACVRVAGAGLRATVDTGGQLPVEVGAPADIESECPNDLFTNDQLPAYVGTSELGGVPFSVCAAAASLGLRVTVQGASQSVVLVAIDDA